MTMDDTKQCLTDTDRAMLRRARERIMTIMEWDTCSSSNLDLAWGNMYKARTEFTAEDFKRLGELARGE